MGRRRSSVDYLSDAIHKLDTRIETVRIALNDLQYERLVLMSALDDLIAGELPSEPPAGGEEGS